MTWLHRVHRPLFPTGHRGDHGAPAEERREENEAGRMEVEFSHRPKFGKEGALDHEQLPYRGRVGRGGGGGGGGNPSPSEGPSEELSEATRGNYFDGEGNQWQSPSPSAQRPNR